MFIGIVTYGKYAALVRSIANDEARQRLLHIDFGHLVLFARYVAQQITVCFMCTCV